MALVVLCWARQLPVPRGLVRPVAAVGAASMWIYISHFAIWPPLTAVLPLEAAYVGTIVLGLGIALVVDRSAGLARRATGHRWFLEGRALVRRRRSRRGERYGRRDPALAMSGHGRV